MINVIRRLIEKMREQDGQALAEYALILAFIGAVCIVALTFVGGVISVPFEDFMDGLQGGP